MTPVTIDLSSSRLPLAICSGLGMPEGIVRDECLIVFLTVGGGEVSCAGDGVRRKMGGASASADFCDD